jgi:hypothetical protein
MLCFAFLCAAAHAQTLDVSAQCNIYGAGHTSAPSSCTTPLGPGILPVEVALPRGAQFVRFSSVTGVVLFCSTCGPSNGPDGVASAPITFGPLGGISGISASRSRFFEGVFLGPAEPTDPAPPALSFPSIAFAELSPGIAQHFFIGDGRVGTDSGDLQIFRVPAGATRLFLGLSDGFLPCVGAYSDNTGSFRASLMITACPSDFNGDGFLDFTDFDAFVTAFEIGDAIADFNADGFLDFTDFDAFVVAFEAGC